MNKYVGYLFNAVPYILFKYIRIHHNAIHKKNISLTKRYRDVRNLLKGVIKRLKVEIISTGLQKLPVEPSFIMTPNHQSFMDALCLISLIPQETTFVAKMETKKMPLVPKVLESIDGLYLDRENLRQEIKVMQEIKNSLKNDNKKWIIFPEGTRTKNEDHSTNEFKPGALKMAMSAGVDIYPVAMWGSFRVLNIKENSLKKFPIFIHIFDPIKPDFYKNMKTTELAPYIQNMIQNKLEDLKVLDQEYCKKHSKK